MDGWRSIAGGNWKLSRGGIGVKVARARSVAPKKRRTAWTTCMVQARGERICGARLLAWPYTNAVMRVVVGWDVRLDRPEAATERADWIRLRQMDPRLQTSRTNSAGAQRITRTMITTVVARATG